MRIVLPFLLFLLATNLAGQTYGFIESSKSTQLIHEHFTPVAMGAGVAFFDYNNDNLEDVYLTGGTLSDQLFKNKGDGTFENVTLSAGIDHPYYIMTHGVASGDLDNDGFRDIIITVANFNAAPDRHPILYHNNGDGTFTNISWGGAPFSIPIEDQNNFSITLGDVNLDGFLDIYICSWIEDHSLLLDSITNEFLGFAYKGGPNRLYLNNGDLTFSEVADQMGVVDFGCSLAAVFSDYDQDRDLDLLIVNDFGIWDKPDALYRNDFPDTPFVDQSMHSGFDTKLYGMGIGVGDYDRDGDLDYYKTSIGSAVLLQNQDDGTFLEVAQDAGVADPYVEKKAPFLSVHWGAGFLDFDNDALLDLAVAKGRVGFESYFPSLDSMPDQLWHNKGNGTFEDASEWLDIPNYQLARGLAYADYDNDGDMDLLFANAKRKLDSEEHGVPVLYQNILSDGGNWLKVKTQGTINNRDGFGTHLTIHVNGISWLHEISGGGQGHLSQHSSVAHFGLGPADIIDSLIVSWPGNLSPIQVFYNIPANHYIEVTEGELNYKVIQGITTGTHQAPEKQSTLQIYPNPAQQGELNLHFSNGFSGKASLRLFATTGQLLRHTTISDFTNRLDVSQLTPGIYLLEVTNGQETWRKRVVIQ